MDRQGQFSSSVLPTASPPVAHSPSRITSPTTAARRPLPDRLRWLPALRAMRSVSSTPAPALLRLAELRAHSTSAVPTSTSQALRCYAPPPPVTPLASLTLQLAPSLSAALPAHSMSVAPTSTSAARRCFAPPPPATPLASLTLQPAPSLSVALPAHSTSVAPTSTL